MNCRKEFNPDTRLLTPLRVASFAPLPGRTQPVHKHLERPVVVVRRKPVRILQPHHELQLGSLLGHDVRQNRRPELQSVETQQDAPPRLRVEQARDPPHHFSIVLHGHETARLVARGVADDHIVGAQFFNFAPGFEHVVREEFGPVGSPQAVELVVPHALCQRPFRHVHVGDGRRPPPQRGDREGARVREQVEHPRPAPRGVCGPTPEPRVVPGARAAAAARLEHEVRGAGAAHALPGATHFVFPAQEAAVGGVIVWIVVPAVVHGQEEHRGEVVEGDSLQEFSM
mmetsp:Transcript_44690/g.87643  ORF Transcript_44690/g.87643 Transcript_44690/m.87643 type:complete len:285 (-) Transcript_44690:296-1150(-)